MPISLRLFFPPLQRGSQGGWSRRNQAQGLPMLSPSQSFCIPLASLRRFFPPPCEGGVRGGGPGKTVALIEGRESSIDVVRGPPLHQILIIDMGLADCHWMLIWRSCWLCGVYPPGHWPGLSVPRCPPPLTPPSQGGERDRSRCHSIARNKNTRLASVPPARSTPTFHRPTFAVLFDFCVWAFCFPSLKASSPTRIVRT